MSDEIIIGIGDPNGNGNSKRAKVTTTTITSEAYVKVGRTAPCPNLEDRGYYGDVPWDEGGRGVEDAIAANWGGGRYACELWDRGTCLKRWPIHVAGGQSLNRDGGEIELEPAQEKDGVMWAPGYAVPGDPYGGAQPQMFQGSMYAYELQRREDQRQKVVTDRDRYRDELHESKVQIEKLKAEVEHLKREGPLQRDIAALKAAAEKSSDPMVGHLMDIVKTNLAAGQDRGDDIDRLSKIIGVAKNIGLGQSSETVAIISEIRQGVESWLTGSAIEKATTGESASAAIAPPYTTPAFVGLLGRYMDEFPPPEVAAREAIGELTDEGRAAIPNMGSDEDLASFIGRIPDLDIKEFWRIVKADPRRAPWIGQFIGALIKASKTAQIAG